MGVIRALCACLLTFSALPMPRINYKKEDMKYMFIFFPLIGVLIGGLSFGWIYICRLLSIGDIPARLILLSIPLIVTGGIHVDGFMDTMDAVSSYKSRDERLAIMKDPHIGGFAVIRFVLYLLLFFAAVFSLGEKGLVAYCFTFILSRAGSGLSVCFFPAAKSEGMLADEKKEGAGVVVSVFLLLWVISGISLLSYFGLKYGLLTGVLFFVSLGMYYYRSKKDYGGITGDLAGAYVLMSQLLMTGGCAILGILENKGVM